jgi:hypothetical protein
MKTPVSVYSVYQVLPKLAIRLATVHGGAQLRVDCKGTLTCTLTGLPSQELFYGSFLRSLNTLLILALENVSATKAEI